MKKENIYRFAEIFFSPSFIGIIKAIRQRIRTTEREPINHIHWK